MDASIKLLRKYTGHENIVITERGNIAIFTALECARELGKKKVLIPDMGGWFTYKKYSQDLGLEVEHIKTTDALILVDYLSEVVTSECVLLYANPGAYIVDQPIKDIYQICSDAGCLVIMDVSGCISDPVLCDGRYADMMLGSFGEWKIINVGYGGFLSLADSINFKKVKKFFDVLDFLQERVPDIFQALKDARSRLKILKDKSDLVKNDLKDFDIVHPDGKGIGVIARYHSETEKDLLISYARDNGLEFVLCPKYIKIKKKAVSFEIKRTATS